jgi:hypothetical protein
LGFATFGFRNGSDSRRIGIGNNNELIPFASSSA